MEGSESEAAFDAVGLNPQLLVNEVLNAVDDMVDGAFDYCLQQAQEVVGGGGSGKSEELARGVYSLRHLVQGTLDRRMDGWEKYCLRHCFAVPEGFVLPKANDSSAVDLLHEGLSDVDLDAQLDLLRRKLAVAGKDTEWLQREICLLQNSANLTSKVNASIGEALQLFEERSMQQEFQDIMKSLPMLHQRMLGMKNKKNRGMQERSGSTQHIDNGSETSPSVSLFCNRTRHINSVYILQALLQGWKTIKTS